MMRACQPSSLALSAPSLTIRLGLVKSERGIVNLLQWLARHNAELLRERCDLPLLYDSGVYYQREDEETFLDYVNLLEQGHEDCDGLAAARAGELIARGYRALRPEDGGFELAQRLRPESIPAWVQLRTRGSHGASNLYHCIVLYRVGHEAWNDDPSARLGMFAEPRNPYNTRPAGAFIEGAARRRP